MSGLLALVYQSAVNEADEQTTDEEQVEKNVRNQVRYDKMTEKV